MQRTVEVDGKRARAAASSIAQPAAHDTAHADLDELFGNTSGEARHDPAWRDVPVASWAQHLRWVAGGKMAAVHEYELGDHAHVADFARTEIMCHRKARRRAGFRLAAPGRLPCLGRVRAVSGGAPWPAMCTMRQSCPSSASTTVRASGPDRLRRRRGSRGTVTRPAPRAPCPQAFGYRQRLVARAGQTADRASGRRRVRQ